MKSMLTSLSKRRRRNRKSQKSHRSRKLMCETLEDRLLLAVDIVWENRGLNPPVLPTETPDNFHVAFGTSEDKARQVVDAALESWEQVINDFNDGNNTDNVFNVTITVDLDDDGCGGSAITPLPGQPLNGIPDHGTLKIDKCNSGSGWFLDDTPKEHSEFLGTISNGFAGQAQDFTIAAGKFDLFSLVTIEMTHLLGISSDVDFNWDALVYQQNSPVQKTSTPDTMATPGTLWFYKDGGIEALLSSNNGCAGSGSEDRDFPVHIANPGSGNQVTDNGITYFGARDVGNACFASGTRYLPSLLSTSILDKVYGYSTIKKNDFPNFYTHLDSNGDLLVRGGSPGEGTPYGISTGNSNDRFELSRDGDNLRVVVDLGTHVPGSGLLNTAFIRSFPLSSINSVTVMGHDGTPSPGADGDDEVTLDFSNGNWVPVGGVTVDGGMGTNKLLIKGPLDASPGYTISDSQVSIGTTFSAVGYSNIAEMTVIAAPNSVSNTMLVTGTDAAMTNLNLAGANGPDTINVQQVGANTLLKVEAGGDNDTITLGHDLGTLDGFTPAKIHQVYGGSGLQDQLIMEDFNTTADMPFAFDATNPTMGPSDITRGSVLVKPWFFRHDDVEDVTVNAGGGKNEFSVFATAINSNLTILGNGDRDTFEVGSNAALPTVDNVHSKVTLYGGSGINTVLVDDRGDALADGMGDTVTITDTTISTPSEGYFGLGGFVEYHELTDLTIHSTRGDDTIKVESTASGTATTINAGPENDAITVAAPPAPNNIPPGQDVDEQGLTDKIKSLLTINGESEDDVLSIVDGSSSVGKTATITDTTIGLGGADDLFGPGGGVVYTSMVKLNMQFGVGDDNAFVQSTDQETKAYLLMGDGDDNVLVDDGAGTVNGIGNLLFVDGQGGPADVDTVTLNDVAETKPTTVTVTHTEVGNGDSLFEVPAAYLQYANLERLNVNTGADADQFFIQATDFGTTTTAHGGDGVDLFTVGVADTVDAIKGPVIVDGGGGASNALGVIDSNDSTADQVTITSTSIGAPGDTFFGGPVSVAYQNLTKVSLTTGTANDTILVQSTASGTDMLIGGGGGTDVFRVDSNGLVPGGIVNGITSNVELIGGSGPNALVLDDSDESVNTTVTVTPTGDTEGTIGQGVTDNYFGTGGNISYQQMDTVSVHTGTGSDLVNAAPGPGPSGTIFAVDGGAPTSSSGTDELVFDLGGVSGPQLSVTDFNAGQLTSSSHRPVSYRNIELIDDFSGTLIDLLVDMSTAAPLGGGDAFLDQIEATSGQFAGMKTLDLTINGQQAFSGIESTLNSLTVLGSGDPDTLAIVETPDGLPRFMGAAPAAHTNPDFQASGKAPQTVGIQFDGGAGPATDRIDIVLSSSQNPTVFQDHLGVPNSGVINLDGHFSVGYESLSPIQVQGAGGTLDIEASSLSQMTEMSLLGYGINAGQISGDGGFEKTSFSGFDETNIFPPDHIVPIIQFGALVNSTGDGGDTNPGDMICETALGNEECTLRAAIEEANAGPVDFIHFNIPGPGPHLIQPTTALPSVAEKVEIDGYTEPEAHPNSLPIDAGTNAQIMIEVNGDLIRDGSSGLVFTSADNVVRGLSITGFGYDDLGDPGSPPEVPVGGIVLLGEGDNQVEGNFIGVAPDGNTSKGNQFYGIYVSSSFNDIGGPARADRNLISGNQGFGVMFHAIAPPGDALHVPTESNTVQGNLIGTNRAGDAALANTGAGVVIYGFARDNLIGGDHSDANEVRNIISGNGGPLAPIGDTTAPYLGWPDTPFPLLGGYGSGIHIENGSLDGPPVPVPNSIQGNFIGASADGSGALANAHQGINLFATNNVTIGGPASPFGQGPCDGECNVIASNVNHGIAVFGLPGTPHDSVIQGNLIGVSVIGFNEMGNGGDGINISGASDILIGGDTPEAGNVIAHNGLSGVLVHGSPEFGAAAESNTIRLNSIHSNALLGIDLTNDESPIADGPTLNDALDSDSGSNAMQNFPVITQAISGPTSTVTGSLNSLRDTQFMLDFYASPIPDPSGYGEGQRWLGSTSVTTDASGNASFSSSFSAWSAPGDSITATATRLDLTGAAPVPMETSEFSAAAPALPRVNVTGGVLTIRGDAVDDVIGLHLSPDETAIDIDFGSDHITEFTVAPNDRVNPFTRIVVEGGEGNDTLVVDPSFLMNNSIRFNGGGGFDTIRVAAELVSTAELAEHIHYFPTQHAAGFLLTSDVGDVFPNLSAAIDASNTGVLEFDSVEPIVIENGNTLTVYGTDGDNSIDHRASQMPGYGTVSELLTWAEFKVGRVFV